MPRQLPASKVNCKQKILWCFDRRDYIINSSNWNLYLSEDTLFDNGFEALGN